MKISVRVTHRGNSGFVASCPSFPGCVGYGQTPRQAREAMQKRIPGFLASVSDFIPARIDEEVVCLPDVEECAAAMTAS